MQLRAKLIQLHPIQISDKNGEWEKQEIIVETLDAFANKVCISIWNRSIEIDKLEIGKKYIFHCKIESKECEGKWHTEISLLKIEIFQDDEKSKLSPEVLEPIGILTDDQIADSKNKLADLASNGKLKSDRKLRKSDYSRQEITSALLSFNHLNKVEEDSESEQVSKNEFIVVENEESEGNADPSAVMASKNTTLNNELQVSVNETNEDKLTIRTIKPHGKLKDDAIQNFKKYGSTRKLGELGDPNEYDSKP